MNSLVGKISDLRTQTAELSARAQNESAQYRVIQREQTAQLYWLLAGAVVALTLVMLAVIGALVIQLRETDSARRDLERMAADLAKAATAAQAGNRAKSEFLATMSHEIRTPMNGVIGTASMLLETELTEEQRRYATTINECGEALLGLLNDILDLSKLDAGRLDVEVKPFDPVALARSVVDLLAARAREKDISVVVSADGVTRALAGDPHRIRQVLLNLSSNAVKFTNHGEVAITVSLRQTGPSAATLRYDVHDTGIGIDAEALPRLFSDFSQVDGTIARRYGGTGLGLAICRRLVNLMHGRVGVESERGAGSQFWFELPVALVLAEGADKAVQEALPPLTMAPPVAALPVAEPEKRDRAPDAIPELASRTTGGGLRILVAEDNLVNQQVARGLLGRLGHQVDIANDGAETVARVQQQAYDLLLMDMQMPGMDGIAATREIRRLRAENGDTSALPIVAMTANAMSTDRDACLAAGMDGFVTKPVTRELLARVVAEWGPVRPHAAAPPRMDALVDEKRREQLRTEIGPALTSAITAEFLLEAVRLSATVQDHLTRAELTAAKAGLYALSGAALDMGYSVLVQHCDTVLTALAEGDEHALQAAMDALDGAVALCVDHGQSAAA